MKVAVIGGNLLGCATVVNLALVDEADRKRRGATAGQIESRNIEVTLFEKKPRLGGNSLKSTQIDDQLRVEVGTYRTLPLVQDTHLNNLVDIANDQRDTFSILGQVVKVPGTTSIRRGRRNAVPSQSMWKQGTHRRVVRSFGLWNWQADKYSLIHSGWKLLDIMYRILDNAIWRSAALAGFFNAYKALNETEGSYSRAWSLAQVALWLILVILSPKKVIAQWQTQYTFWGTTLPLIMRYGITPAIARGSTIGFVKLLSDIKTRRLAALCTTVGTFIDRCGFENYLRGTGDDFTRIFKYDRKFVDQYLASTVAIFNQGASMADVSTLASHFSFIDGDEYNSDASTRISTIKPHNAALCAGLILAARVTTDVDLRYNSKVNEVSFDAEENKYILILADNTRESFDSVILCASPRDESDLKITSSTTDSTTAELLGFAQNQRTKTEFEQQELMYRTENNIKESEPPVESSACSHFAVVVGQLNASFFRYAEERFVPDLIQVNNAPGFSRFERIRETTKDQDGVYTVLCGSGFESEGLFNEMFQEGAVIRYHEPLTKPVYARTALPEGKSVDSCCPPVVLGPRFIYAAAFECLAKHPEMDAIAAVNAASFFSDVVNWSADETEELDEGEGDDDNEDLNGDEEENGNDSQQHDDEQTADS